MKGNIHMHFRITKFLSHLINQYIQLFCGVTMNARVQSKSKMAPKSLASPHGRFCLAVSTSGSSATYLSASVEAISFVPSPACFEEEQFYLIDFLVHIHEPRMFHPLLHVLSCSEASSKLCASLLHPIGPFSYPYGISPS